MAKDDAPQQTAPHKRPKWPVLIGVFLFFALGGGAFYAVYSGVIRSPFPGAKGAATSLGLPDVAFVPLAQLTISLGKASDKNHLQFTAQLEVNADRAKEVADLSPRILDVMNTYLRAVDMADLVDPDALVRLRAQLLRRIQIVTGQGCVRDLLVTQFVLD